MTKKLWLAPLLGAAVIASMLAGCSPSNTNGSQSAPDNTQGQQPTADQGQTPQKQYAKAPDMKIDKTKHYTAILKTNKGDITIDLFADKAPITVNNFVFLSNDHYYDNVKFHRVIKDFMIQTGDPTGTGRGNPGYSFQDELPPAKPYAPGIVAMANAGPNTNGSQFFIGSGSQVDALNRMPNYTVFGQVTSGMDVVQKIASVPVEAQGNEMSKPTEDVHINSVTIQEK